MRAVGICDLTFTSITGLMPLLSTRIMGHEIVGVVRTGEGVHSLKRETASLSADGSCGKIYACRHGRSNVCSK